MSIQYTKIQDGKVVHSEKDNQEIIQSCFNFCIPSIQRKVKEFLEDWRRRKLTLSFKSHKVRLEK